VTARPPIEPADPRAAFLANEAAVREAIDRVLSSGQYILGPEVNAFEAAFAQYLGGGYVAGVANGTDAIEIALRAVGVRPGDAVLTVANTVSATAAAIQSIGARPVFVEIDADTMCLSAAALEAELEKGRAVRAAVPVHLYGNPADMHAISAVCDRFEVAVVEDCAQAHGARIGDQSVGTFGQVAAFSFYPTKNLAALGDGGGIFTRDADLDEQVRLLRQYGWRTRYVSEIPGRNSRLDELQAAILLAQLQVLDAGNAHRDSLARRYSSLLESSGLTLPLVTRGATSVWHQYAVRTPDRVGLREKLRDAGINAAILYPVPLHHQPAWIDTGLSLRVTEAACREILCLPCHPGMGLDDVDRVCEVILR
jgi:aminotransferase EvaB